MFTALLSKYGITLLETIIKVNNMHIELKNAIHVNVVRDSVAVLGKELQPWINVVLFTALLISATDF